MTSLVAAVAFVWLGLVLGLSFIEAPLKFRAPGVTVRIGLGIGRLVFAALNRVECALALVVVGALVLGPRPSSVGWPATVALLVLIAQLVFVRPALHRRSNLVLAGEDGPRSRAHLLYNALEVAKAIALVVLGVQALGAR